MVPVMPFGLKAKGGALFNIRSLSSRAGNWHQQISSTAALFAKRTEIRSCQRENSSMRGLK
jgi:hypothetical protein